jgi:hypothetical protein
MNTKNCMYFTPYVFVDDKIDAVQLHTLMPTHSKLAALASIIEKVKEEMSMILSSTHYVKYCNILNNISSAEQLLSVLSNFECVYGVSLSFEIRCANKASL